MFSDPAFSYWSLQVARALLWVLDAAGSLLMGQTLSQGSNKEREEARNSGRTAQMVTVVAKAQYIPVMPFHRYYTYCTVLKYQP